MDGRIKKLLQLCHAIKMIETVAMAFWCAEYDLNENARSG